MTKAEDPTAQDTATAEVSVAETRPRAGGDATGRRAAPPSVSEAAPPEPHPLPKAVFKDLPFDYDPKRRSLSRVGVIDVGSNSVRLVVFDGAARSPAYFFNEKVMAGLGRGVAESGRLNPEGRERALRALKRFARLAEAMGAPVTGVATAAVREAEDGRKFLRKVKKETGLRIRLASGEQEARLAAEGVLVGWPDARGLVCDIGGASMELAELGGGRIGVCQSSPLGPLNLATITDPKARRKHVRATLKMMKARLAGDHRRIFLVGGSWRAIARLDMLRRDYPLKVLHEYRMDPAEAIATVRWTIAEDPKRLRQLTGTSLDRLSLVPLAGEVLEEIVSIFRPEEFAVSSYGIREGLLYERMPADLRRRDPLIEACSYMEYTQARFPGFGKALYRFLKPVFRIIAPEEKRLVKAACLLHDVSWRAHPDYRAEVCFETITRANLGGVDHPGRIFLGTALLHRYKTSRKGTGFDPLFALLDEKRLRIAETLGKGMRFGAMLSGSVVEHMGTLSFKPTRGTLKLKLPREAADLMGEVVEQRFRSFAKALGVIPKVEFLDR